MDNLQAWARVKAIEWVCPNSGEPTTPYEHGAVKELTAFLSRTLPEHNYDTTLDTFKKLKEIFQNQKISDLTRCIAGCLAIDSEIAHITGIPAVSPADVAWAQERIAEIEAETQ